MEYRKWIWIELIGFDNTLEDLGVAEYIDRLGFVPEVISFLIFSPDFFHQHVDTPQEIAFPLDYSSYNAHPFNAERDIQIWTNTEIKKLVEELHRFGVKVIPAVFSFYTQDTWHKEWLSEHPEVFERWRDGTTAAVINPLKCLADGTLYEDFFFGKMMEVLRYYDFDGWHAADGWAHPRTPIWRSDYSDDMVGQFLAHSGLNLPVGLKTFADADDAAITDRAEYIYYNYRLEWARFYAWRWAQFHKKAADLLHKENLLLAANAAWTRDPFEALYRYGVDYTMLYKAGVDVLITESAAAAADMEAGGGDRHQNFVTTLLLTGVNTPQLPLIYLNGLKDVMEQWDVLRHVPAVLEKEIFALSNVYKFDGKAYSRCAHGPLACLGDGIEKLEWRRLKKMWDLAFDANPVDVSGPLLIWSSDYIDNHVEEFQKYGAWSVHKLVFELAKRGAWITSACGIENLSHTEKPVLLVNPHELSQKNLHSVLDAAKGGIIAIGLDLSMLPNVNETAVDKCGANPLICGVVGFDLNPQSLNVEGCQEWNPLGAEPVNFLYELNFSTVSEEFLHACVEIISQACNIPKITDGKDDITVRWLKLEDGVYRVVLANNSYSYVRSTVQMPFNISSLKVSGLFPIAKLVPDKGTFSIKIPGKGITLVDVFEEA